MGHLCVGLVESPWKMAGAAWKAILVFRLESVFQLQSVLFDYNVYITYENTIYFNYYHIIHLLLVYIVITSRFSCHTHLHAWPLSFGHCWSCSCIFSTVFQSFSFPHPGHTCHCLSFHLVFECLIWLVIHVLSRHSPVSSICVSRFKKCVSLCVIVDGKNKDECYEALNIERGNHSKNGRNFSFVIDSFAQGESGTNWTFDNLWLIH